MQERRRHSFLIVPLGECSILVRFDSRPNLKANRLARALAAKIRSSYQTGIVECVSNLVSVQLHYEPLVTSFEKLRGELMTLIGALSGMENGPDGKKHHISIQYDGPDLDLVTNYLGCSRNEFVAYHSNCRLTAMALGFSPGFLYLGMHENAYVVPRSKDIRENVAPGSVLFAASQTAITSRSVRTGWCVIGRTEFRNFNAENADPVTIVPGDQVIFDTAGKP